MAECPCPGDPFIDHSCVVAYLVTDNHTGCVMGQISVHTSCVVMKSNQFFGVFHSNVVMCVIVKELSAGVESRQQYHY